MESDSRMSSAWVSFLFAEDLSTHLLQDIDWTSSFSYFTFRDSLGTTFSPEVGDAVSIFSDYFDEHLTKIVSQLTPYVLADSRHFSNFMYYLADAMFRDDFFLELVVYCGCVIYVAKHFHSLGHPEFLDHAVVGIAFAFENKLKLQFQAEGSWEVFRLYCEELAAAIKVKQDKL